MIHAINDIFDSFTLDSGHDTGETAGNPLYKKITIPTHRRIHLKKCCGRVVCGDATQFMPGVIHDSLVQAIVHEFANLEVAPKCHKY